MFQAAAATVEATVSRRFARSAHHGTRFDTRLVTRVIGNDVEKGTACILCTVPGRFARYVSVLRSLQTRACVRCVPTRHDDKLLNANSKRFSGLSVRERTPLRMLCRPRWAGQSLRVWGIRPRCCPRVQLRRGPQARESRWPKKAAGFWPFPAPGAEVKRPRLLLRECWRRHGPARSGAEGGARR